MREPITPNSEIDEQLRYMLLPSSGELRKLERQFAGSVRLGTAGRYGCRLLAGGSHYEFSWSDDVHDFVVKENGAPLPEGREKSPLFRFVRHRVGEVILAVRGGHYEFNARRERKKRGQTSTA